MASSVPTRLIFLADLPAQSQGDKVRFLGCVDAFDIHRGILHLRHAYQEVNHEARVDTRLVREDLHRTATDVGSWITVMGYVMRVSPRHTEVHATLLQEATPFRIEVYERALQARKDVGTTG